MFIDQEGVEVNKHEKKRMRPISSHLNEINLGHRKDLLYVMVKKTIFLQDTAFNPKQARHSHLACLDGQLHCMVQLILLAHGASL